MSTFKNTFRQLTKTPAFTATAVLTLALGIGACTTMYSVIHAVMLRPLPVRDQDELVLVWQNHPERNIRLFSQSIPNFFDYRDQSDSFAGMAAMRDLNANVRFPEEAIRVAAWEITARFTETLGWTPILGRGFRDEEDLPGAPRVVMIGEGLWRDRFESDAGVLGRVLEVNGEPHEIVGVLGREVGVLAHQIDLWRPMSKGPRSDGRDNHMLTVIGRLKPGVSREQAESELRVIAAGFPAIDSDYTGWGVWLERLYDSFVPSQLRVGLIVLFAAVGCVLLIACSNVTNLLLSRALTRERETSVRLALGAGRRHLIHQVISETAILAVMGTLGGVFIAFGAVGLLRTSLLDGFPRSGDFAVNGPALLFAVAVCVVVTVLAGLLPALRSSKGDPARALSAGARAVGATRQKHRTRLALVVAQFALSCVLLIAAGLMMKSFHRVQQVDPGFTASGLLTFQITPDSSRYGDEQTRVQFYQRFIDELSVMPGVSAVGMTSSAPFGPGGTSLNVFSADPAAIAPDESVQSAWRIVSPAYFGTLQIPLLEGRAYSRLDNTQNQKVIIISERLADTLWPGESALGKRLGPGGLDNLYTVVGVVGEARMRSLTVDEQPAMYFSSGQWWGWGTMTFVVRGNLPPETLTPAIRHLIREIDPAQPVFSFNTVEQYMQTQLQQSRLNSWLLGAFACIALLLAAVGIYGVMAAAVTQRTSEIGIRMAVGAQRGEILGLILKHGLRIAVIGVVVGLFAALLLTRSMESMVFGVSVFDPLTFLFVPLLLLAVTLLACALPALRAARTSPMEALRQE